MFQYALAEYRAVRAFFLNSKGDANAQGVALAASLHSGAVLDGSEALTGWTNCTSAAACGDNANYANIYYAFIPAGFYNSPFTANLRENDDFLRIAQDPNQPGYRKSL